MKLGYYIQKAALAGDARVKALLERLEAGGASLYEIRGAESLRDGTAMVLSFGGDGTFLSCARLVCEAGTPILGVNFGRMGFLSENRADDVVGPVLSGSYRVEERTMLKVSLHGSEPEGFWPYALNEAGLHRNSPEMLGIEVVVGDWQLPAYWADGLLAATSSGSTAYSLSAGGPICAPDADVMVISPVAPHNLNLRPLVIPAESRVTMGAIDRGGTAMLALDNRSYVIPQGVKIDISAAPFRLKRVCIGKSNFIDALKSRLFWGQDVRNISE